MTGCKGKLDSPTPPFIPFIPCQSAKEAAYDSEKRNENTGY